MASIVDDGLSREPKEELFALASGEHHVAVRHRLSASLGFVIHATAIGTLALLSLLSADIDLAPARPTAILQFAPPPPPPLRRGSSEATRAANAEPQPVITASPIFASKMFFAAIPDAISSPTLELGPGFDDGFDDGDLNGLRGGVPAGVIGGVPGGLPGGALGGTGTELPRFPKPDVGPRPIRSPRPRYTEEAIREKVTGSVKLRVIIDEQGLVHVLKILTSIPELDEQAIRVVESSWRFSPATKNGRPIKSLADLIVHFNLN